MFGNANMKKETSQKYFVTGGAGFIGSHLVDRLIEEGKQVVVYDNLSSGSLKNLVNVVKKKNFKFIKGDLVDYKKLKKAIKNSDVVFHLASNTNMIKGNAQTDIDLKDSIIGTRNLLEAMRTSNIKKLYFASSGSVYGNADAPQLIESYGPLLPISLYGAGKLAAEGLVSAFCELFDIKACIFRFGNICGHRIKRGVVYDFVQKLKQNPKELLILGDGHQSKNYLLVDDCIDGMFEIFDKCKKQYDTFNIGNDAYIQVNDIADIVAKEMNLSGVKYKHTAGKGGWKGDIPVSHFNIDKARKLGWSPKYDSAQTVRIAARRILDNK